MLDPGPPNACGSFRIKQGKPGENGRNDRTSLALGLSYLTVIVPVISEWIEQKYW